MAAPAQDVDLHAYSSLLDLFDQSCARFSDQPMVTCMGVTLTYSDVDRLSRNLAAYLQNELGMRPGDRIAIQLPNLPQYHVAVYAACRAGLIIVNTNPLYTPRELKHQFSDAQVETVITLSTILPVVQKIRDETPLKTVIVTGPGDLLGMPVSLPEGATEIAFLDALEQGAKGQVETVDILPTDLLCLQYTGGTTGLSKGAMLSHGNLVSNVLQVKAGLRGTINDNEETYVVPIPLYHIYAFGLTFGLLAAGGQLAVLVPDPRNMDAFVAELKRRPFTGMAGLNTLFVGLCHHPGFRELDFSRFKLTASGGMALNKATARLWEDVTGVTPGEGYGLTETSPTVTMNSPDDIRVGTVGRPLVHTEIKVIDEEGNALPSGEVGELCVRGPQVMQGYWNRPEETARVLDADGWLKTGDMAIIQEDGFVRIVDRLKDMILVSGFNVYPNEIEDVVMHHPGVLECAAIGVPDEKSGEAVKLFVVRRDPALDADSVRAYCKENLTSYKCPKFIEFRDELPKSNVGKILRRELRD